MTKSQIFKLPGTVLILMFFALLVLNSCQKENLYELNSSTETSPRAATTSDDGGGGDGGGPLDCENIKKRVYNDGGMLVFQDLEHLWNCADCLEIDYQNYNDNYESQYPNATPEELDELDERNRFDHWQPFIDFESSLGFNSLRANVERAIVAWEETPIPNINPDDDPDDSTPIMHENVRALFNERGMAMVGGKVLTEAFFNEEADSRQDDCGWALSRKRTFTSSDDPNLNNREIKLKVGVRSGLVRSKLKGKIVHKRRVGNKMKRRRAHIRAYVGGRGMSDGSFGDNCDISAQFWNSPYQSYKKRRVRRVRSRIWSLWREACVDTDHPQFNTSFSRVVGWWNDGSTPYTHRLIR